MGGRNRTTGLVVQTALLAAVYVLFARLGLRIHPVHSFATLVWPPTGIALAALLGLGFRVWPGIAAGALIANFWTGAPLLVALGIAAGNTLEAVAAAWLLSRIGFSKSLPRLRDVLALILVASAACMISATIGVASLRLAGIVPAARFGLTWRFWWLGDAIGALVVAPLILTWRSSSHPSSPRRIAEGLALAAAVGLGTYVVFEAPLGLPSLVSPLLVWAAVRFEQRGAARAMFLTTAIGVWATVRGHGPFAQQTIEAALFVEQAYMVLSASTFLLLGAAVGERRRAEEARRNAEIGIRESEVRYRTLAEAVDQLLWINDASGRTTYVNPRLEALIGGGDGVDLSRASWSDWIHPEDRDRVLEVRSRALAEGAPYDAECRILTQNGDFRWILSRVVPVKDADGKVTGWFGAAADVHDLKRAESELRHAKDEAETANRSKDQFLAALSHELRTPLTPVLALASALEVDENLPPDARRRLRIVRRNAELEARLIDDLLDLTRIARGKMQIETGPVDLDEAIDRVVEICRPDAAAKGLSLEREGAREGATVRGDPARIQQVFWNLVNNAIKFTPEGGRIVLRRSEPRPGRVAVEVVDTGSGIDPAAIGRIFQPFEQATHRTGGLGLGLAISTALVEAHGGTLAAASDGPGRGATFRVELETMSAPAGQADPAPREADAAPRVGRRVLLIDDHGDTLAAARDLLLDLSCDVVTAGTVQEAMSAAAAQSFDLVLSDLGLPDGSGLELMRTLRHRYGLAGIAVSGYGMAEDVRRSREAGFVEHLVKPITFERLRAAVDRFFATPRTADIAT